MRRNGRDVEEGRVAVGVGSAEGERRVGFG